MEALLNVLGHLRDDMHLGLKYYSDITMSPIIRLLSSNGISGNMPDHVILSSAEAVYN
jgi:hypothetical protein